MMVVVVVVLLLSVPLVLLWSRTVRGRRDAAQAEEGCE